MPLYVFECPEHGRFEELVRRGEDEWACPRCLAGCRRAYQYSVALGKPSVDLRGMYRRFSEASAEHADKGVDMSGAWPAMKARGRAMDRAGENPLGGGRP